jgi:hypothetical protein
VIKFDTGADLFDPPDDDEDDEGDEDTEDAEDTEDVEDTDDRDDDSELDPSDAELRTLFVDLDRNPDLPTH